VRRAVFHVDIDAFFPSVEELLNPAIRGKPIIVGSGVIASCSYRARESGLSAGMSIIESQRRCPQVIVLRGNQSVYRAFAGAIWELCRNVSPTMETYLDEAYIDMSGTELLWPDLVKVGAGLKRRIRENTGMPVTIGIGPNRLCARIATKMSKPDGLGSLNEHESENILTELHVGNLPGVGRVTARVLEGIGIHTVRELRTLASSDLVALFGKVGAAIYERARGRDTAAIDDREVPRTISRETTFHNETSDTGYVEAMISYLVQRAARTARTLGIAPRTVELKLRYSDYHGMARRRKLPEPTNLDGEIYGLARTLFHELHTRRVSLRHVGVTLSNFVRTEVAQMKLFDPFERDRRLTRAIDSVRSRFGFGSVITGKALELMNTLERTNNGYVLRTPSLTK